MDTPVVQIGKLPARQEDLCSHAPVEFLGYSFCGTSGVFRLRKRRSGEGALSGVSRPEVLLPYELTAFFLWVGV